MCCGAGRWQTTAADLQCQDTEAVQVPWWPTASKTDMIGTRPKLLYWFASQGRKQVNYLRSGATVRLKLGGILLRSSSFT